MVPQRFDCDDALSRQLRAGEPNRVQPNFATGVCFGLLDLCAATGSAQADWIVCNRTRVLVNLAVGSNAGADFATEGWWTVTPGSCATPLHGPLSGRNG